MSNYSLYAIPAAWALSILPHMYAASLSKSFDNRTPRRYTKSLEQDQTIDKALQERIIRAEGAQMNGFENLALFASAVVAGNLAGIPPATLNKLCGGYLVSRVVYNVIYITNTSQTAAGIRSLVYGTGIGHIFALFIKAANILKDKPANLL